MRKFVIFGLLVLLLGVFCEVSFAGSTICPSCYGSGKATCLACRGSGICPTCNGQRRYYVPSFGTGRGDYVNCQGCYGSGRCWKCNGRSQTCTRCSGKGYIYAPDPDNPNIPPSLAKSSLNDCVPETQYSDSISARNGQSPYTWVMTSGTLPAGISFASSGDKAVFYGTATQDGTYLIGLRVTDANGRTGEGEVSLKVCFPPLTISGWVPGDGKVGEKYNGDTGLRFSANDGYEPYVWKISNGSIPPGMYLTNQGNGVNGCRILGAPLSADTYNFTLSVTDGKGRTAEKDLTCKVNGGNITQDLKIDDTFPNATLASWTITKYDYYVSYIYVKGGSSPYTWSLVAGNVPQGTELKLSNGSWATDWAKVLGWPSDNDSYKKNEFALKVVDAEGRTLIKKFSIAVPEGKAGGPTVGTLPSYPVISGKLSNAFEGKSYSGLVTVTKGKAPYTWSADVVNLPDGLTLSFSDSKTETGSGLTGKYAHVKGTPKSGGIYGSFTLKVTDADGITNAKTFAFKISQKPSISGTLVDGIVSTDYSGSIRLLGGTPPYKLSISKGKLPTGLTLTVSGDRGILSGTLQKASNYSFTVKITDSKKLSSTKAMKMSVIAPPTITTATLPYSFVSEDYSVTLKSKGTAPFTWNATGLPDGFSCSNSGTITGKPSSEGTFNVTVTASNDAGQASKTLTLTVKTAPKITTSSLAVGYVGKSYNAQIKATGSTPITYSASSLPKGLSCASGTGKITGTPKVEGKFNVTLKASAYGKTVSKKLTLTIKAVKPAITTNAKLSDGAVKKPYSVTLKATGTQPITWSKVSGNLPNGLTLNKKTGKLSGTPKKAGTFTFKVKAENSGGNASRTFTVKITEPTISGTFKNGTVKAKYTTCTATVSGGTASYTWTKSGTIPNGMKLKFSGAKATLSGTPKKAGTFEFTLKATDKNGAAVSKKFTVKITEPTISGTFKNGTLKAKYTAGTATVSGGTASYTWTSTGTIPNGMTLKFSGAKATLSGTPKKAGTFEFTLKATDKNGATANKKFTVKVTSTETSSKEAQDDNAITEETSTHELSDGATSLQKVGKVDGSVPSGDGTASFTPSVILSVESDDIVESYNGKDSDLVKVKADKPLHFIVNVSEVIVYVDEKAIDNITVSPEGKFTLPAELVHDDFKISVKSGKQESEELFIIAE